MIVQPIGETVETVGEVHRIRRADDDEGEKDEVNQPMFAITGVLKKGR